MKIGYIKLHRKILEHWLYIQTHNFSKNEAWIDLLLLANHKTHSFAFGNEILSVSRGEVVTSEIKLTLRWNWSKTKVRNFLRLLEKDGMIVKKPDSKKTVIFIKNYGKYQDTETGKKPEKNQMNTVCEPGKDTMNNDNNYNNEKNENIIEGNNTRMEINNLMLKFIKFNPAIKHENKTQRKALEELLSQHSYNDLNKIIEFAFAISDKEFAPVITTPFELKNKFLKLKIFFEREKNNRPTIV